jgi:hypothetical protein
LLSILHGAAWWFNRKVPVKISTGWSSNLANFLFFIFILNLHKYLRTLYQGIQTCVKAGLKMK